MVGTKNMPVTACEGILLDDDVACPSCKSTRRSSPSLQWKFSTKCYHRVCEGCIDRRFVAGKAECPIESCKLQLWKSDWRKLRFEDVQMERDIASRQRVMQILNRDEDEFETKRDWDDFLELREELIMNLSFGTDVAATNRKLDKYQQAVQDHKKRPKANSSMDPTGLIHGLKKVVAPEPIAPYDPFMGMPVRKDYYELREDYPSRYDRFKTDADVVAGGFDFQQFWDESMLRAFAGLGCFIEDEMAEREEKKAAFPPVPKLSDGIFSVTASIA